MASPIITGGLGTFGSVKFLVTGGYDTGQTTAAHGVLVQAREVFTAGAMARSAFTAGMQSSEVHTAGAVKREVSG